MSRRVSARWLTKPVFGWRDVGIADLAFAVLLSADAVASTSGLTHPNAAHTGLVAALAVLLMTAPVAIARRDPLLAAGLLAAGAAFNWLVIGHMVRCGAALPAAFYVAFTIGSRCRGSRRKTIGMVLIAINIACQGVSDPRLGASVVLYMVPIAIGFMAAGRLLQSRNAAAERLRARTAELREQREQNAQLAVAAEQARIADDLERYLPDQIDQIAAAAASGQDTLTAEPDEAQAAFVAIQDTGRETLAHMRGVVATLRDNAPTEPQPVLAQLDRLLGQAMQGETRLQVTGDPALLPPGRRAVRLSDRRAPAGGVGGRPRRCRSRSGLRSLPEELAVDRGRPEPHGAATSARPWRRRPNAPRCTAARCEHEDQRGSPRDGSAAPPCRRACLTHGAHLALVVGDIRMRSSPPSCGGVLQRSSCGSRGP